jgi:glutathione synthase/RimK-type ligase-like ATP-grasp enzyme
MLLIVTNREDYTADWLILELERRSAPYLRLNTEDAATRVGIGWRENGSGWLHVRGVRYELSDITAVWFRRPVAPSVSPGLDRDAVAWAVGETLEALEGLWRTLDALWVNHPQANAAAASKPEQLRTARQLGFEVPATLVTNDREALAAFADEHGPQLICKPLREGRVVVAGEEQLFYSSLLDRNALAPLDDFGPEPYLVQQLVPKRYDIRVTVIGNEAQAVAIESQEHEDSRVDWRRGDIRRLRHRVEPLPHDMASRCVDLSRHYGLSFAAIDLARTGDGGFKFFEINANGQWVWLEQVTGLPLSARLADLLLSET